jgi:serine protease Do
MKNKIYSLVILMAIFVGIVSGLIIASNFDFTSQSEAASPLPEPKAKAVVFGSQEPVPEQVASMETMSKAFTWVAKEVNPAVVTIKSKAVVQRKIHPFFDDDFFRRFFNMPQQDEEQILRGLGSGVIVKSDGYIVTNNHVVDEADEIQVSYKGEEYKANVVGTDPLTDVAVIKIDKENLATVRLGDSDELEIGEWVLAIGNPFDSILQNTVTAGIVSAKGRSGLALGGSQGIQYQDFIQTDAAINPGNSGGALVNLRGELVGINTAIVGQANVGIGFAIPVNMVKDVMEQLVEKGRVIRGFLGVNIQAVDEKLAKSFGLDETTGVLVTMVQDDSPAEKAGLRSEDIILEVNGKQMESVEELQRVVASYSPGSKVDLTIWRNEKEKSVEVKLGERPGSEPVAESPEASSATEKLGFDVQALTDDLASRLGYENEEGVLVSNVKSNSVADLEGIRKGDLITAVNRNAVKNLGDFNDEMEKVNADEIVLFRLKRGNVSLFAALRMPDNE